MSRKEHEETLTTIMDSPDNFTHQTGTMREITDETSTPESLTVKTESHYFLNFRLY